MSNFTDDDFRKKENMSSYYRDNNNDIPDYLAHSILVTIFCCMPLGIPAIVFSALSKGQREAGNYREARQHSQTAKNWCIAAFVLGLIFVFTSCTRSYSPGYYW